MTAAWQAGRAYWHPEYMQRWGVRPRTVIDVGVGNGTPHLYDAYPDAQLVLVEPLAEFAPSIASTLAKRPGVHFPVAAGRADAEIVVHVEPHLPERSSAYGRHALEQTGDVATARRVPVTTLDQLLRDHDFPGPYVLKIDAEGAELDVVRGAADTLRKTELVIAEVNVLDRFDGGYSFDEFVAAMSEAGFAVRDLLDIGRADSSEVTFVDLVFRRREPVIA